MLVMLNAWQHYTADEIQVTDYSQQLLAIILTLVLVVLTINLVRKGVGLVQQVVG